MVMFYSYLPVHGGGCIPACTWVGVCVNGGSCGQGDGGGQGIVHKHTPKMVNEAGGAHPIGMHSCFVLE